MQFAIMLSGRAEHPYHDVALRICRQALSDGHSIALLFFTGDAVITGSQERPTAAQRAWQQLARDAGVELIVCSRSADELGLGHEQLAAHYALGGLALWVDASLNADRSLRFGGA